MGQILNRAKNIAKAHINSERYAYNDEDVNLDDVERYQDDALKREIEQLQKKVVEEKPIEDIKKTDDDDFTVIETTTNE